MNKPTSVNEYLAGAPPEARSLFGALRRIVPAAAPDMVEAIS
jgi:hypothetical protein